MPIKPVGKWPRQHKGPGTPPFLREPVANAALDLIEGIDNLEVVCPQTDGVSVQQPKFATIKKGGGKLIITMPPTLNTNGDALPTSGGGSGLVQRLKIVSDGGDWYVCEDAAFATWYVIKDYHMMSGANAITSESIDVSGTAQTNTYTYAGHTVGGVTAYYTRHAAWTLSSVNYSETDYPTPRPIAGDYIMAIGCTTTILTSNAPPANPSGGQLIDLTPRFWAK